MPIERLTPLVKKYDLGCLRLWQDELAEIVRLIRQLPGVEVRIESDNNLLTDVQADLPQLGPRVSYFYVTASRPAAADTPREVISVRLATGQCEIESTEPDLTTTGLIESIKSLTGNHRRLPTAVLPIYRSTASVSSTGGPQTSAPGALVLAIIALTFGIVFGIGAVQHLVHPHGLPWIPWPTSILVSGPVLVIAAFLCFGFARARTLLVTATRAEAPTFWQRKRSDIAINVVVGLIFYFLGLLTAHL